MPDKMLDINADLGESFGRWKLGDDERLMPCVTSVNIATGFHAGDPSTIAATMRLARQTGVAVGAHPGFPDLLGFGRRAMAISPDEAADYCVYQLGALMAMATREGLTVQHVKPHGAFYFLAVQSPEIASAIASSIVRVDASLILVLMDGPGAEAAEQTGIRVAREAYVDLDYDDDGMLIIERVKLVRDPQEVAERAIKAAHGVVVSKSGQELSTRVDTICIHGDAPNAVNIARTVRERLAEEGIVAAPLGVTLGTQARHATSW